MITTKFTGRRKTFYDATVTFRNTHQCDPPSSPDIFVLLYVEAVKVVGVGFILLFALRLGQPLYHFRFQRHGDVARQHRQEELLLVVMDTQRTVG